MRYPSCTQRTGETPLRPVEELLQVDVKLPSPPAIAARILDIVRRDNFSFVELAQVVQTDPALTGRVLRVANSGFYSLSRNVTSIETAVAVMGVNAVKNIALSFIVAQTFHGPRGERFDFERLWRRSITAAVAAQLISKTIDFKSDETFIASLLQDTGIATLAVLRKHDYLTVLDEKVRTGLPVTVVERQVFGFDHQEVGAELLRRWGLPESVCLAIRHHHDPDTAPHSLRVLCTVLWAADRLSSIYHGVGIAKNFQTATEILTKRLGLDESRASTLIDAVAEKSTELLSQFSGDHVKIMPFSQMLQEANTELSRLNFSYDLLLLECKETTRQAERLAAELRSANERLREAAYRDGLTGLHNRQYFQETLERELMRSQRHLHPLSLILFDIDQFKKINDTYGHHCGDIVLKTVSQMMVLGTRRTDILARYGGEEFAILLPETDLAGAIKRAESCLATIGNTEIEAEEHRIRMTVSLGIAHCVPSQGVTAAGLIKAADRALYLSKRQGRNRITVWDWDSPKAPKPRGPVK
jgi:diguanylate cyclase (GGDEF)-like protein